MALSRSTTAGKSTADVDTDQIVSLVICIAAVIALAICVIAESRR